MRKSFLLHLDSLCILEELEDVQKGQLFNAIYKYQLGEEIELLPIVKIAFSQFKNQFQRDNEKYKNVCEVRKQAGSMGGKQRVANQANATNCKQTQANQADNKNKNKSDSDKENDKEDITPKGSLHFSVDVVLYLNDKARTNFRNGIKKTISLIDARRKEGFTLEDFKKVIDNKVTEWKNDNKMCKFLRPETLFGNKFESYLNQKVSEPYKKPQTLAERNKEALDRYKQSFSGDIIDGVIE